VTVKETVFWGITPCGSCKDQNFGGKYRLHHQVDKNRLVGAALEALFVLSMLWLQVIDSVAPSSPIFVTLMTEAILSSVLSVLTSTTRRNFREDGNLQLYSHFYISVQSSIF
jgi:hypothetical protein